MTIVCHPNTWGSVVDIASEMKTELMSTDGLVVREDGLVSVPLSGVQLAELLQAMRDTWMSVIDPAAMFPSPKYNPVARAVALRIYLAVGHALKDVRPHYSDGDPVPPILLDDKLDGRAAPAS